MNPKELQTRLKKFALRLEPIFESLPNNKISGIIKDQLLPSGFSSASNYKSAYNAQSGKSFNSKISILSEAIELTKIPGASGRTAIKKLTIKN